MSKTNRHVLPGFSLSLGYTLLYLSLLTMVPLVACFSKAFSLSFDQFWAAVWTPRTIAAYQFSLMVAYSSTSFGILFVSFFKIFFLRPARRRLVMETEAESPEPVGMIATPTLVSP